MSTEVSFQFHQVGDFMKPIQSVRGEENALAYYRWDNDFVDWPVEFSGRSAFPEEVWSYLRTKWEEIPVGSVEKYVYFIDLNDVTTIKNLFQKYRTDNKKSLESYELDHIQYTIEQFEEFESILNTNNDVELWMKVS